MTWSYVIVIDQGTHSTRAIIYDHLGKSIFKSQKSVDLFYRDSLHIEQDGQQILSSCNNVLKNANEYIKDHHLQNIAVAITTQRSTVIAWDADTGVAVSPALSWLDTRTQCSLGKVTINEDVIKEKTGLPLSPHYGASKLKWLLEHDKNVKEKKQKNLLKLGPLAAFLIYNLVKDQPFYIDYSNAHRTLLWNIQTKNWDEDLIAAFLLQTSYLPKTVPNSFQYGNLNNYGYPLILVNGDQNSAIYGYGKLQSNTSFVNIGTGAFVLAKSKHQLIKNTQLLSSITYSSNNKSEYVLEGTVNGAGAALSWAEEKWKISQIESVPWAHIENVPIFLNTVGGLGSPFWRSDINPRFLQSGKTHNDYSDEQCMAALMESIAFLITINIQEMQKHGIITDQLLVAGGMSRDEHLCQCLANLCSANVIVSDFKEATSRGAAWLTMQQPEWELLRRKFIYPVKNDLLLNRYEKFRTAIQGLLH